MMATDETGDKRLEDKFCNFFAGGEIRKSKKGNIEENLVWGYLVHHLDEDKVSSSDLAAIISADYYAGFLSEKNSVYTPLNQGRESLLEHLAGNFSEFNTTIKNAESQPAIYAETDKNFSLVMLWQTYLSLLRHRDFAQMVNDARDITDLKGIIFLDLLANAPGNDLDGIINSDMIIREKTVKAMERYAHYLEEKKAKSPEPEEDMRVRPTAIPRFRPSISSPDNFWKPILAAGIGIALLAGICYFASHPSKKVQIEQVKNKEELVYIVKRKDTLRKISGRVTGDSDNYGLIAEYNNIRDPNHIDVDQAISIPKDIIKESDQLHKIRFTQQNSSGRYYAAAEGERFEDIVDFITGSSHNSGIILEYNRWINPSFDTRLEKGERIYFPQEFIKEERK